MMANVGVEFQFGGSKKKPEKAVALVEKPPETEVAKTVVPVAPEPAPEPAPTPVPAPVKPEPATLVLRIKFGFDSAKVDPAYHSEIEKAVQFMNEHPGADATIEGHTCDLGTDSYNMGLSRRRAESVKAYMIKIFNVDGERLSTLGYGESRPDHDNSTLEGKRMNRRVVIRMEEE
jgi:OOP family OmpA-OmpF porin